jgi:mediator of RNA polymerase II transcription subunit 4
MSYLRLSTPEVSISLHDKRVAQLPISKNLDAFEETLKSLLTSISRYAPSVSDAEQLLEIEGRLNGSLEDIIAHQRAGLEIDSLQQQSTTVDQNCREILKGLGECRRKLMALPSLERVQEEQQRMQKTQIKADELLAYAMKLAKFTTAPPTFDNVSIGPNNFIWPAEDSLRRGMLAIASLNEKALLGEGEPDKKKEEIKEEEAPAVNRRGSFGSYGDTNGDDAGVIEDLDLFDMED